MEDFLSFNVEYRFTSNVGFREASACISSHKAVIYAGDYDDNSLNDYAGEVGFKLINIYQAIDNGYNIMEMFDTYEYTMRHGEAFYDLDKLTFRKQLLNRFPDLEFYCPSICILETIGIVPKYRGQKLGAKVFKEIVWNFSSSCGLFVQQPFPLQFDISDNDLKSKLELDHFEKDEKAAFKKLKKYYQAWGFVQIKGIKNLMFYSPIYKNAAFDKIDNED